MMSKRCFFRYLREDMRHKVWMLALSVLGNMLAIPVAYLLTVSRDPAGTGADSIMAVRALHSFFVSESCAYGGIIAVIMAFVIGFAGFRHLFHRNMVDTCHSMPVKRNTLFLVNWLDGLLIWLVPFAVCMGITVLLGEIRLGRLETLLKVQLSDLDYGKLGLQEEVILSGGTLFLEMLATAAEVLIAFLLVYHLVLLAVMLCGNALNAICVTAALGCGVISCFCLGAVFCTCYFETFAAAIMDELEWSIYASPLVSSACVLIVRSAGWEGQGRPAVSLLIELAIAFVMGIGAAFLYNRRPSELAEQGLRNKPVSCLIRAVSGVTAGMGGWMLFLLLTEEIGSGWDGAAVGWSVFGGVLASVIVFGVLDIIFHMDFKAFFAHRKAMAATAAVTLGLCFAFRFDWFGYDTYLPKEGKVAEISLCSHRYNNGPNLYYGNPEDEEHTLNRMHLTDRQAAYDFLQAAVRVQSGEVTGERSESFLVKVTLESGREYYREYRICDTESEAAYVLLASPEYQREAYVIPEEAIKDSASFCLWRGGVQTSDAQTADLIGAPYPTAIRELCAAYNKDIQANPKVTIKGDGILLCMVRLYDSNGEGPREAYYLDVYDTMKNTVEVLKKYGFDDFVEVFEAEDTAKISLSLYLREELQGPELVEVARTAYGAGISDDRVLRLSGTPSAVGITVTDPEEIAELMEFICYNERHAGAGIFYPGMAGQTTLTDKDGTAYQVYIPKGVLPEKYILRFGEISD